MSVATAPAESVDVSAHHYTQLDGLRGLAILLVIVYHFSLEHAAFRGPAPGFFLQLAQAGWMGVDLFFVLSGFLITGILSGTRSKPHYFRNFLARRFLRIWPLYYLSLLVLLVVAPLLLPQVWAGRLQGMQDQQAWFWLYAANWLFAKEGGFSQTAGGYFWSLAVEEQFYVIWPFVVYALSTRMLLRVSFGLLCCSLLLRVVLSAFGVGTGVLYNMTFTHLDGLATGACLSICLRSPELTARVMRALPWVAGVALLGLVAVRLHDHHLFFWGRAMAACGYTLIVALFAALLVLALRDRDGQRLRRFLRSRFMSLCGTYSYALYLVHVPVASLVYPALRKLHLLQDLLGYDAVFLLAGAVAFAISWALAAASWFLIESRILAFKRYFAAPPGPPPGPAGGVPTQMSAAP